ncbi:probable inactive tRNA-specific adenosine deaminase-like protein 3 [Uloborus diversus]|uniref:probable inactive tRNA-specific adenosine deaminase-like protein 3 n=1 Tax=Uloborus diversus TaxID=327109 RepID=UPI002409F6BB|nr:probable inactive tRNA-specific adenosine deaminase-like protein 3 [Uloborus diversus]
MSSNKPQKKKLEHEKLRKPMIVGKIKEKKETSRLIKELAAIWPLDGKSHLKRVRRTSEKDIFEILLRPLKEEEISSVHETYSLNTILGMEKINKTGLQEHACLKYVPKHPPLTYEQYKEAIRFWPVQFREDKYTESILSDKLFSLKEKEDISMFMRKSISAAEHGDEKVGCIIVDPSSLDIVAIAHDCRNSHPLQHAVMVAVDLVAKSQGGGSWKFDSKHIYHAPFVKEEYERKIAALKKSNPEKDVKKMCMPYLCTGMDAYITREPCIMCAMALVHSRIRRVFYGSRTSWGALGSHHNLHLQQGLNHHYEVWGRVLESECSKLEFKSKLEQDS